MAATSNDHFFFSCFYFYSEFYCFDFWKHLFVKKGAFFCLNQKLLYLCIKINQFVFIVHFILRLERNSTHQRMRKNSVEQVRRDSRLFFLCDAHLYFFNFLRCTTYQNRSYLCDIKNKTIIHF